MYDVCTEAIRDGYATLCGGWWDGSYIYRVSFDGVDYFPALHRAGFIATFLTEKQALRRTKNRVARAYAGA